MHMERIEVGVHTSIIHRQSNLSRDGHIFFNPIQFFNSYNIWRSSTILCKHGKKLLIKMRTILKGLAHKSTFDVPSSFWLNLRCAVFSFNGFLLKTMRRRKRAWRVRSCSVLRKWRICDVPLSHGVVLEWRLIAAFFTGFLFQLGRGQDILQQLNPRCRGLVCSV